ncbi:MAG: serine hydrolase domain-containing protein [Prolixibacteraceae bacterium]
MKKHPNQLFSTFILVLFLLAACSPSSKTASSALPRSIPEAEGVSSEGILDFLDAAAKSNNELHSFIFIRHGKVIAEGWWKPYQNNLKHTLYSTSKSFTSTAIGFAVSEQLLTVNDQVISFFPDDLPDSISSNLANLKIKHLLSMSAGQDPEPTFNTVRSDSNWVKSFLATPIVHEPGTVFLYNSLASYMLSAIVQKVSGQTVKDYLTPRLFEPLAIEGYDWEIDPQGINTGGWGLRLKTEDMAKFGQLLLQKGKWNEQQIIPAAWVDEATTAKIDQNPNATPEERVNNSWLQGYGYQFWRCQHNAFRADGAYGQYIIVMPDQDAVVAIQAETADMQDEINLVWDYLLPAIKEGQLPIDTESNKRLKKQLAELALPIAAKQLNSQLVDQLNTNTFKLASNQMKWKSISFQFNGEQCALTFATSQTEYPISFNTGKWAFGETSMLGPNLLLGALDHHKGLLPEKIAASFSCIDENTIEFVLRYIETPHTEKIRCTLHENELDVQVEFSQAPGSIAPFKGIKQ